MNNISFTSRIKIINSVEFEHKIHPISTGLNWTDHCATYPWTLKQSVYNEDVYTGGIYSCSACLIKDADCGKSLLMHLCPENRENHNFYKVGSLIKKNFDISKNNLQALLIGSNKSSTESYDLFEGLEALLKELKIQVTSLQNATPWGISLAYKNADDEISLCFNTCGDNINNYKSTGQTDLQILRNIFKKVFIAKCDNVK